MVCYLWSLYIKMFLSSYLGVILFCWTSSWIYFMLNFLATQMLIIIVIYLNPSTPWRGCTCVKKRIERTAKRLSLGTKDRGLQFLNSVKNEADKLYIVWKTKCTSNKKRISTSVYYSYRTFDCADCSFINFIIIMFKRHFHYDKLPFEFSQDIINVKTEAEIYKISY